MKVGVSLGVVMSTDWEKKQVRTGNMMGRPGDFMTLELS